MRRLLFVAAVISLTVAMTASAAVDAKFWQSTPTADLAEAVAVATGDTEPTLTMELDAIDFPEQGDLGDNYVSSVEGWIIAPSTGDYTFYIAGDDHCGLFLSPDADAANISDVPACQVDGWANRYDWTGSNADLQTSAPVTLQAGYHYAFRAVQREGGGGKYWLTEV